MEKKEKEKSTQTYVITPAGSLGLLAYGYKGIQAWREVREKAEMEKEKKNG